MKHVLFYKFNKLKAKVLLYLGALRNDNELFLYSVRHPSMSTLLTEYNRRMQDKVRKRSPTFRLNDRTYHYFNHDYNATWSNERSVEIPLALELVQRYQGRRILEVGNVLSHYFPVAHTIVDKYEQAHAVINQDIEDFRTKDKYDLIVSISTLEHIGWDERIKDKDKFIRVIEKLKEMLSSGGELFITLPAGYNPWIDKAIKKGLVAFDKIDFMKRRNEQNEWVQCTLVEMKHAHYNYRFHSANVVIIAYTSDRLSGKL